MTAQRRHAEGAVATVQVWGRDVGAVAEPPGSSPVVFEYDDAFRSSGLEISPINLPLSLRGPQAFPGLARTEFQGLPGVLADSLPDAFGNAVIRRYFESKGNPDASLSPVQRLLYVGRRAMGALEYLPAIKRSAAVDEALEVADLVRQARLVVEGDTSVAVPEMMQLGASAGGVRAKALVLWNAEKDRIRSGFAEPLEGDEPWLIKFDGVTRAAGGHEIDRDFKPGPWGRIEFAYSALARRAGITMAPTHLLRERDFAHFMTRRFDRAGGERIHLHTLGGLLHIDYNIRQALDYEAFFRTIQVMQLGFPALEQAFLRMVFNVAARNQDDHVKNISFLMHPSGQWELAPAYDLLFAAGGTSWTRTHQMRVNGKDDDIAREDVLAVGEKFGLPRRGADAIAAVAGALVHWQGDAREAGVPTEMIRHIEGMFRRLD